MSAKEWEYHLDQESTSLVLKVTYDYDSGCPGDYATPPDPPSVSIQKIEVSFDGGWESISKFVLQDIEEEIMEYHGHPS